MNEDDDILYVAAGGSPEEAIAYSQKDGPPGRSVWPLLAALVAMLVVIWLLW